MNLTAPPPYPRATVRLQLSPSFTFADAQELVPYFAQLGVSHVYASPILTARSGSTHGYDIVDHTTINPEYGGERGLDALVDDLHQHHMGLILDFVPNHMGIGFADNEWWQNVLEYGKNSPYAHFFDIDWTPSEPTLRNKVLVPILGGQYGDVLEQGELKLVFHQDGRFTLDYYDHSFPLSPSTYATLLQQCGGDERLTELIVAFQRIGHGSRRASRQAMLIREAAHLRSRLAELAREGDVADRISAVIDRLNGEEGQPQSFDALDRIVRRQAYRLSYWRLASNEINYRRFFDINSLAAIRMELPQVFEITHQLVLQLIGHGKIQGIRLDHVDGLLDPKAYLERLQQAAAYRVMGTEHTSREGYHVSLDQSFYVLVEKILAHHESLRESWPISGTTGYEFMTLVSAVQVDPAGEEPLTALYEEITGRPRNFPDAVLAARYRTMRDTLASELNVLATRMTRLAKRERRTRDFSRLAIRDALTDIVARFPVYRTYADSSGVSDQDRRDIEWAVATAKKASHTVDTSAYDFVHAILTTDLASQYGKGIRRREVVELAMRVQQFTAPVMAKSVEDTVFYRDARLIARNEVGGDPEQFYTSVKGFHHENKHRQQHWPFALLSTATHDHKRGEDVRARLNVISELSTEWHEAVLRFQEMTAGFVTQQDDRQMPSPNDRYFLLQTIVGAWPPELDEDDDDGLRHFSERVSEYMLKAVREAKVETSWTASDVAYERALTDYVEGLLHPTRGRTVVRTIRKLVDRLLVPGVVNSLAQKALLLTVPGVPDVYQGSELWDLSLVDPDNRRRVDFNARRAMLDDIDLTPTGCAKSLADWRSGSPKLLLTAAILGLRKRVPDLFAAGQYVPLDASGTHAENVIAFARSYENQHVVVVVPRCTATFERTAERPFITDWNETTLALPAVSQWTSLLDGRVLADGDESIALNQVFEHFPVAVLHSAG